MPSEISWDDAGIRIDRSYRELPAVDCNGFIEELERGQRDNDWSVLQRTLAKLDAWAESAGQAEAIRADCLECRWRVKEHAL